MDLNKIIRDLYKGTNVETNLKDYMVSLGRSYYMQASYTLAMNLMENYDRLASFEGQDAEILADMFGTVKEVLNQLYIQEDSGDLAAAREKLMAIRGKIVAKTDAIDAYTYILQIYEHIFNREEYRFRGELPEADVETFMAGLMNYIASNQDAATMNQKIQTVMSELPVRLTTGKFIDMITTASACYTNVRSDLAEDYFENLYSSARPFSVEALDPSYENLYAACKQMLELDVTAIDEAVCAQAQSLLQEAAKEIADVLMGYLSIVDIVNDLLIIVLEKPVVDVLSKDMKKAETVIREVIHSEMKGTFMRPDENIIELLTALTDRQSVYQGEHMMLEDAFYGFWNVYKDVADGLGLTEVFTNLHMSLQLTAASPVKKLDVTRTYATADADWMKAKQREVREKLEAALAGTKRPVKRAIMALTFSVAPVCFNRLEDFRAYAEAAITDCGSNYEKQASMDLINKLMN